MECNSKESDLKKGGSYEKAFEKELEETIQEDFEKTSEEDFQKTVKKTIGKG